MWCTVRLVLSRPDPQSFTRFLVSAGVFFCLLAFIAPALVIRESGLLRIGQDELDKYTPIARTELRRRQVVAKDVAHIVPYVGGILLIVGVVVLVVGVPRLIRQERHDDEHREAQLDKLRRDTPPQGDAERRARLEAEVDAVEADGADRIGDDGAEGQGDPLGPSDAEVVEPDSESAAVVILPTSDPPSPSGESLSRRELMNRVAGVESRVLGRVRQVAGPLYDLRPMVRAGADSAVLLDGLLVSQIDQLPDVGIEIKYFRSHGNFMRRLRDALSQLSEYGRVPVAANSRWWLIVVADRLPPPDVLETAAALAMKRAPDVIVSIVEESEIDKLELPRGRLV